MKAAIGKAGSRASYRPGLPLMARVRISKDAEDTAGDALPHAGREGIVVARQAREKYQVLVPGMPLVLVMKQDMELVADASTSATAEVPATKRARKPKLVKVARPGHWRPSMGEQRKPSLTDLKSDIRRDAEVGRRWDRTGLKMLRAPRRLPSFDLLMQDMADMMISQRGLAKYLGVSRDTLRRWVIAKRAPRPATLALFWESQWGRNLIDTAAGNDARLYYGYCKALQRENERLGKEIAALQKMNFETANSPVFRRAVA